METKEIKNKNPKGLKPYDRIIIGLYTDAEKVYDLDFFKNYINDQEIECIINNYDIIDEWYMYDEDTWNSLKNMAIYDIECDNEWSDSLDEEANIYAEDDYQLERIERLMKKSPSIKAAQEHDAALREHILEILNEVKKIKEDVEYIKTYHCHDYNIWPPYITYPNVPPKQLEIWYNNDNKENSNPNKYNWRNSWVYDPGPYCSTISSNTGENSTITTTDQKNKEVCVNLPSPTNYYTIENLNVKK